MIRRPAQHRRARLALDSISRQVHAVSKVASIYLLTNVAAFVAIALE
jgi:hypothetical protein